MGRLEAGGWAHVNEPVTMFDCYAVIHTSVTHA